MDNINSLHFHVTKKEHKINLAFNCDSSNDVYLFDCVVFGFQYMGFNMRVALACILGLGLIIRRRAIVYLVQGLQFPRWTFLVQRTFQTAE